jgi:glucokinase
VHAGLEEIVSAFVRKHPSHLEAACFDVAGPVQDGKAKITNLSWVVDARRLSEELNLDRVTVVNDLAASAYGIAELCPADLETLRAGEATPGGNVALISAGTGLGEAGLYWDGQRYHALASEGGHTDFGPRSDLQAELYAFLACEERHVSYERLCSGIGIPAIYRFLRARSRTAEPCWLTREIADGDPTAVISNAGLRDLDPVCAQTLDVMVSIYGAEAGNLALKLLATGGIYVGGGIAPRILPKLRDGTFLESLVDKGRFRETLERIPVNVILNEQTSLLGAARIARGDPPDIHRLPMQRSDQHDAHSRPRSVNRTRLLKTLERPR